MDLAEMIGYKISNIHFYRYICVKFDNFSNNVWAILLKSKKSKTITDEFSIIVTNSKTKPNKIESD